MGLRSLAATQRKGQTPGLVPRGLVRLIEGCVTSDKLVCVPPAPSSAQWLWDAYGHEQVRHLTTLQVPVMTISPSRGQKG